MKNVLMNDEFINCYIPILNKMKISINYDVINQQEYTSNIECRPREFFQINENIKISNNESEMSDQNSLPNTP